MQLVLKQRLYDAANNPFKLNEEQAMDTGTMATVMLTRRAGCCDVFPA
jgi:hypothetical protein